MEVRHERQYPERNVQADCFLQEVTKLCALYRPDLYCEEIGHRLFSLLERPAINRRRRYVNIDMPIEVRTQLGIPFDYAKAATDGIKYNALEVATWHGCREDYMGERATDPMDSGTVALVVCGQPQMGALARRFRTICATVREEDMLATNWYLPEVYTVDFYLKRSMDRRWWVLQSA